MKNRALTERVEAKCLQARYDMYIWAWNKGDEWLSLQNMLLQKEGKAPIYGTVEDYYHYYLEYWSETFKEIKYEDE